jgi:hypothetical protein
MDVLAFLEVIMHWLHFLVQIVPHIQIHAEISWII